MVKVCTKSKICTNDAWRTITRSGAPSRFSTMMENIFLRKSSKNVMACQGRPQKRDVVPDASKSRKFYKKLFLLKQ